LFALLIFIHVVICLALILVILLQSSKGEGLASAFGGSSLTGAVFGGRGAATFLSKATTVLAIAFMVSCLILTFVSPARQITKTESALKKEMSQQVPGGQPTTLPGQGTSQQPASGTESPVPPPAGQQAPTGQTQPQGGK
jgi:preprotein translocase subunit SecG